MPVRIHPAIPLRQGTFTLSGVGDVGHGGPTGTGELQQGAFTLAGAGAPGRKGTGALVQAPFLLAGAGVKGSKGTGTPTQSMFAIANGAGTVTPPPTVIINGDSITDYSTGYSNFNWSNGRLGGKLQLIANIGTFGDKIENLTARLTNTGYYNGGGYGGKSAGNGEVRIGTNNARNNEILSDVQPKYHAAFDAGVGGIASYVRRVIVRCVPPLGDPTQNAKAIAYNAWLAANYNSGQFYFLDDCALVRDVSGNQLTQYFIDGVHPNSAGIYMMGLGASLDAGYQAILAGYPNPVVTDPLDVYPTFPQWTKNPTMVGTGGSHSVGASGVVANFYNADGAMTAVFSKVAADGGDPNQVPWQRCEITARTGSQQQNFAAILAGRTVTTTDPSLVEAIIEYRLVNFDTTNIDQIGVEGRIGSDYIVPSMHLPFGGVGVVTIPSVVVREKIPRISNTGSGSITFTTTVVGSGNISGSIGYIDMRCFTMTG